MDYNNEYIPDADLNMYPEFHYYGLKYQKANIDPFGSEPVEVYFMNLRFN